MDLQNVGILPQYYTASQPRRPRLEFNIHRLENLKSLVGSEQFRTLQKEEYSNSHRSPTVVLLR
jgi:hypothetical protein